jgi:hypothetical protein
MINSVSVRGREALQYYSPLGTVLLDLFVKAKRGIKFVDK